MNVSMALEVPGHHSEVGVLRTLVKFKEPFATCWRKHHHFGMSQ